MKTRYKWTVEDYHQLIETGLLEGKPVELLEGELIVRWSAPTASLANPQSELSPEGVPHSFTNRTVADYLRILLQGKAFVSEAHPITLDNSEPEPDIAVVRLPKDIYKQHHPYPQDIYWLIEISNYTLEKAEQCGLGGFPHEQLFQEDLKEKTITYARNGISEYWVIDLPHKKLWVFTQPTSQGYSQIQEFTSGNISPLSFPDVAIAVNDLLLY